MDSLHTGCVRGKGVASKRFRAAMMACGLNVTATARYLGVPFETVKHWANHDSAPQWSLDQLRELYIKIYDNDNDIPEASGVMQRLLDDWLST